MSTKFLTQEFFGHPQLESTQKTINAGTVIYQPVTPAQNMYYLQQGEVRLFMVGGGSEKRLVGILGPGDWFGETALARRATYSVQAVAMIRTTLIEAPADRFMQLLATRPEALLELSRDLADRLLSARRDASEVVFDDSDKRLMSALVRFSGSAAATRNNDEVVLRMTHDQLAQAVGVARETVSVSLQQLRRQNLLQTRRGSIVFNPKAIKACCEASGVTPWCCCSDADNSSPPVDIQIRSKPDTSRE